MSLKSVYILKHLNDEDGLNSLKQIGVYTSETKAQEAIVRLQRKMDLNTNLKVLKYER